MKTLACFAAFAVITSGQSTKNLPNQAGNREVGLIGQAITDQKEVAKLLGVDLGEGYVVVKIRVLPQTGQPLRISIDDFTLVSRKDGEKSGAMAPHMIAGGARLVLRGPSYQGGGLGQRPAGGPGGTVGGLGRQLPAGGGGIGNTGSTDSGVNEIAGIQRDRDDDPRLGPLEEKILKDAESTEPVEGLLYFYLEQKVKPKDLGMIYSGPAGRLVIDFK